MKKLIAIFFIILSVQLSNAQNYISYLNIQYDTIPNVNPNLLSLDIYVPNNELELRPVVVYVHGGSWRAGDKANVHLKHEFFTNEGYIFISVNYRLSPNPPDTNLTNAVRFPEHPRNVAKAIAWIYNNVHNYGGDKNKIGLTGHSAGGHIAAVVATNISFLNTNGVPNKIPCVCMFDAAAYNIPRLIAFNNSYSASIKNAMGNDPNFWDDASPAFQIRSNPGLGEWILFSQDSGSTLYDEAVLMSDTLTDNGYNFPHYALALEHDEINGYVGIQDSASFVQLLIQYPYITPSPNAYAIALAYTDSIQSFFQNCFNKITTDVNQSSGSIPETIKLSQNYPNPFNPSTKINWQSPVSSWQTLRVYDMLGNEVVTLVDEYKPAGKYEVEFNAGNLSSGVYFYTFRTQEFFSTKKFILLR